MLHFTDIQFQLLSWAQKWQPWLGLGMGGVGAVFLLIATLRGNDEQAEQPPAGYGYPPSAAGQPPIPQQGPQYGPRPPQGPPQPRGPVQDFGPQGGPPFGPQGR